MKDSTMHIIGALASHAYQEKYILHGTREEYELPDEMIEDAVSLLRRAMKGPSHETGFAEAQRAPLAEFLEVLEAESSQLVIDYSRMNNDDVINRNSHWSAIRDGARHCLEALGVTLKAWEAENL